MKKIVGILAAAAVLATSVFAADISAGIRLEGELFSYKGSANDAISALMIKHNNQAYHAPMQFAISTDRAGATFQFTDKDADNVQSVTHKIWFKPFDILTINLGGLDMVLNQETIDYGGRLTQMGDYNSGFGYNATLSTNGLTFKASLVGGNNAAWFSKGAGDPTVAETDFLLTYGADFGTLGAMAKFTNTFKKVDLEFGYSGKFGDLSLFADGAVYLNTTANTTNLGFDFDVAYNKDAISAQAYAQLKMPTQNINNNITLMTVAKFGYKLDAGTVWVYFKDANLMANNFGATFKLGWDSKVGIMDYQVVAQIDVATKVDFSVPVWFKVNF
jgi:hypothetical protein